MGVYVVPYLGETTIVTYLVFAFLVFGFPLLVGALVRSPIALVVPAAVASLQVAFAIVISVIGVYDYDWGLAGNSEVWIDPFSIPVIGIIVGLETGSAAIGIAVGKGLARLRDRL